jgi:alkanesulfonate monooxygenase SsuD/methylene tetrahydromethanopterin reductase-like flavin-dependent oxidoreductase (luciferase family)
VSAEYDQRLERLSKTNPLFGERSLKLGTFCSNVSGGGTASSMEGTLKVTWPNASVLARMADEMDFEAIVPVARWRGFGGDTDFNGSSFESMTFAAGLSAVTRAPAVAATIHVPAMHPVLAAKQAATIDHIGSGRFTLNIVTGRSKLEVELFGSPLLEHDTRFDLADEWITLMKLLWTSEKPVQFDGRYFVVHDAYLRPQPIQPYPTLMGAASSPRGKLFTVKHCDIAFVGTGPIEPEDLRDEIAKYRQLSYEQTGHDIKVWMNAYMICGDTHEDAQKQFKYCVHEMGDWRGIDNLVRELGIPDDVRDLKIALMAGWGGYRILGTKEEIVDQIKMLKGLGIDGMLLSWPAYMDGMSHFREVIYPLLVQEGLRG